MTNSERDLALVNDLLRRGSELDYVEYKENNIRPDIIGELVSALANSARLQDKHSGFIVWGVRDSDHTVCGTRFDPQRETVQRQPLEFWLAQRLSPSINFSFKEVKHPLGRLIVLERV